jgi:hypothetical protein
MKEIDLIQAMASWINLAYTAANWWITVTTALIVATYFAAKHIPAWFFALIVLLYLLTAISVVFEVSDYSVQAYSYGVRLAELRAASHIRLNQLEPGTVLGPINSFVNYAVFVLGSISAVAYSYIHWRRARSSETSAPTAPSSGRSVD